MASSKHFISSEAIVSRAAALVFSSPAQISPHLGSRAALGGVQLSAVAHAEMQASGRIIAGASRPMLASSYRERSRLTY
jgi:hypothetical protein